MFDTGVRSLKTLSENASTSRVLNLSHIYERHGQDKDYLTAPFFYDPHLNRAIFVKHRLRADEAYLVPHLRGTIATKIIFPFDATSLRSGGRSLFIGQTGFKTILIDFLGPTTAQTNSDMSTLELLERLPSLDPFLLKEYLARHQQEPAECYFDISQSDVARMQTFVQDQMRTLICLALSSESRYGHEADASCRLVEAMMGRDSSERLDPLRLTLGMNGREFEEGLFSWKGLLYYKWLFTEIAKNLNRVMSEIDLVRFIDKPSHNTVEEITEKRKVLRRSIKAAARTCTDVLTLYDDAFVDLVDRGKATAFRKFLFEAPKLFVDLGDHIGSLEHIVSFWRFKFPEHQPLSMHSMELSNLLIEFQTSLTPQAQTERHW